jgi:hypothetical protein
MEKCKTQPVGKKKSSFEMHPCKISKIGKISPLDKVQALKHSKQYIEDYRRYEKAREKNDWFGGDARGYSIRLSKAGKKLCEKYNIRYPINPFTPADEKETVYVHYPITFLDPPKLWNKVKESLFDNAPDQSVITHVNDKLVLMIDTEIPRSQIRQEFENFLNHFTKEPNQRLRESINIWKVYRMKEFENKNLLQITKEVFNIAENPTYSPKAKALYNQVSRAYNKAKEIIKLVIPPSLTK